MEQREIMFAPSLLLLNVHVKNGEQGSLQFLNSSLWVIELHNIKIQRTGRHMPDQCTALLLAADLERSKERQTRISDNTLAISCNHTPIRCECTAGRLYSIISAE
jgi:hypothetical protein